jgi:hypothetical protein
MPTATSILPVAAAQPAEADGCLGVASTPLPCEDNERDGMLGLAHSDNPGKPVKASEFVCPTWTPAQPDRVATTNGDPFSPILTIIEAAEMLGISQKRMQNIIAEEKTRLGRLPEFVCDAGGKMRRRIIKDQLIEWLKSRKVRRGRPSKTA